MILCLRDNTVTLKEFSSLYLVLCKNMLRFVTRSTKSSRLFFEIILNCKPNFCICIICLNFQMNVFNLMYKCCYTPLLQTRTNIVHYVFVPALIRATADETNTHNCASLYPIRSKIHQVFMLSFHANTTTLIDIYNTSAGRSLLLKYMCTV